MPALARLQENTPSIVNWFVTVNGVLTDCFEVGFRIFDISGGLPGTQVFPVAGWEDVTNAPGNFSVGSYYAYDNTEGKGYTPPLTATVGTHRIEWRWKITSGAPYQAGQEDFEVLVQSGGSSVDTYITVQDVRDEGLEDPPYSDAKILSYIETWQAFIDRACRQWFVPKDMILEVDGTDSDMLSFGVPIISIDYIQINNSGSNLDTSLYKVYNSRYIYPAHRQNPRIKLVNAAAQSIFTANLDSYELKFRRGRQNQLIKGIFGYTESDGSVPKLIKRALLKLVIEKLTTPIYGDPDENVPNILGPIQEEWTDGHKIKYRQAGGVVYSPIKWGFTGITTDHEILSILKMYRAPLGVATPASPSYD